MFTLWLISKAASALDFVRRYLYVKKHRPNKSCFVDKLKNSTQAVVLILYRMLKTLYCRNV